MNSFSPGMPNIFGRKAPARQPLFSAFIRAGHCMKSAVGFRLVFPYGAASFRNRPRSSTIQPQSTIRPLLSPFGSCFGRFWGFLSAADPKLLGPHMAADHGRPPLALQAPDDPGPGQPPHDPSHGPGFMRNKRAVVSQLAPHGVSRKWHPRAGQVANDLSCRLFPLRLRVFIHLLNCLVSGGSCRFKVELRMGAWSCFHIFGHNSGQPAKTGYSRYPIWAWEAQSL